MEAPRGAREPTGTNGPTPHQPPQPGTHPPKRSQHRNKEEGQGPPAPDTEQGPAREGTRTGRPDTKERGRRNHYTNHDQPTPHPATQQRRRPAGGPATQRANKRGDGRHNLVVVTAPGKRPATFRTWKLSPAAPMVLHPRGCGRVGNRHNTPEGGPRTQARPPHTHTQTRARGHTQTHPTTRAHTDTRNDAGTHPHTRTHSTRARARNNARGHTRDHTQRCAQQPSTTASYCARPPSGLRLFMFQQSSGR